MTLTFETIPFCHELTAVTSVAARLLSSVFLIYPLLHALEALGVCRRRPIRGIGLVFWRGQN